MTAEGHRALDDELKHLKSVERPAVIQAISEARDHGDRVSENAEKISRGQRTRQSWIEGRVVELEDKLARAQIIDVSRMSGEQVKSAPPLPWWDEDTEAEATYKDRRRGRGRCEIRQDFRLPLPSRVP